MAAAHQDRGVDQSLEDATVALINSDPELRDELRELIKDALARYRHVIKWGQPDARLAAIKAIVPGLMRAMGRVEQSESDKQMRDAYDRLLNGAATPVAAAGLPAPVPSPAVVDAPPVAAGTRKRSKAST